MKLATYKTDNLEQPGFAIDDRFVSLEHAFKAAGLGEAPRNILTLIESEAISPGSVTTAFAAASSLKGISQSQAQWLPPVRGYKILAVAANNSAISKLARVAPENPPFFLKAGSSLVGHGQNIVIRPDYGLTHPEAELGVVIGKRCKHVAPEDAMAAIFGYTIVNDITSVTLKSEDTYVFPAPRDGTTPPGFQWGDMQLVYHARSKSTDTFGPMGPWIVTADEICNPNSLEIKVFMGDEEVTTDNTANLKYSVQEVISWASRFFTLEPGDVIHLGTAATGRYSLRQLDLQVWDGPVAIEIQGIGRISNPVQRVDLAGKSVPAKELDPNNTWPPRQASSV